MPYKELADLSVLMTPRQVSERHGLKRSTVYWWIDQGTLPAYRIGPTRLYIDPADVRKLIRPAKRTA